MTMAAPSAPETKQHNQPVKMGFFEGPSVPDYDKILNCVRCGMCLPHCPTYSEMKVERASPRGRAALIRAVADGRLEINEGFSDQVFLCLDCRACETACPSGVRIGYLIESARSQVEQHKPQNPIARLMRSFIFNWLFMRHSRLELFSLPLRLYQQSGLQGMLYNTGLIRLLPKRLQFMESLTPKGLKTPFRKTLPDEVPAMGDEQARVGYFLGCMMSIMFNKTTNSTVNVLTRSGCRVVTPKNIRCCGAPLLSEGFKHKAVELMKDNIDTFEKLNVDYIVTDCAACGAAIKEYEEIFEHDDEYRDKAKRFSEKCREITEFLAEWPHYKAPLPVHDNLKVVYDEPCHLCHAQQVWKQPKKLIQETPGVEFITLPESEWCCGSAGVYNITHYQMAMKILDRKMDHVAETGAEVILTANPGCLLQLNYGVMQRKLPMQVKHVVELIDHEGSEEAWRKPAEERCQTCGRKPRPECRTASDN
ncbi:MAG: 4Fe-4S dicluster domain-containing protein [bacterium]|nr:4Fe-4S dicluster domain-containing protein [bacterium]